MAQIKDKHYWSQLRSALTGGLWGSATPAKAYNGASISWFELLRKFNKHCHGFKDVAEIASQTQALALLLAEGADDADLDGDVRNPVGSLALDEECVVSQGRREEAKAGYDTLRRLESESNSDSLRLALAWYTYALDRPQECLSYINQVSDLADAQSSFNPSSSVRATASILQVPSVAGNGSSSSFTGSFAPSDTSSTMADVQDGKAWAAIEIFRSVCLQGMAHEKLFPSDKRKALSIYIAAVLLLPNLESDVSRTSPANPAPTSGTGQGRLMFVSFTRYRELWRWIERLLWRAIIVASQSFALGGSEEGKLWSLFTHYQTCSAHWPPTFRTEHRSTISVLHLRALILRSQLPGLPPIPSSAPSKSHDPSETSMWLPHARRIVREYRDVLTVSTRFPKAGERNTKVEEFIDLCVAVWDASGGAGEHAGWVIDILWWATRLTFNSYRVFRHMTRVSGVAGDTSLAKRTLRLYTQVVSKALETGEDSNADTDVNWVETLVWGARMLCRVALQKDSGKDEEGIEDAKEAGELIAKAKARLDEENLELKASVKLAEGIWHSTMAITEQDHLTRSSRLSAALSLIEDSLNTFPTASAYFQHALALSRPVPNRDLDRAIESARAAVEAEPSETRHWHLLGLLLATAEDWRGAKGVLEVGAAIDEDEWSAAHGANINGTAEPANGDGLDTGTIGAETMQTNGETVRPSHTENGSAKTSSSTERPQEQVMLLDEDAVEVPSATELLRRLPDHPTTSKMDQFDHAVQLRMTQLTLTELLEGSEGAGEKWVELFGWFAERKGVVKDQSSRTSMDTNHPPDMKAESMTSQNYPSQPIEQSRHSISESLEYPPTPVPIMLTPPTPGHVDDSGNSLQSEVPVRLSFDSGGKEKDTAGKKVQKMLKSRVHKGQQRITTFGKRIGHGVGRSNSLSLRRSTSTPGNIYSSNSFMGPQYQASSIHSRRQFSPFASSLELPRPESPPPPPPPTVPVREQGERSKRERRLLSDLWLMSAATFRRSGKIEQARGAIQEAEVRDEENPAVWVQLGLHYTALNQRHNAIQAFNKALFLSPDNIPATIHLCQLYLSRLQQPGSAADNVDLAAGMLADLTRGPGWDVAEAWYFLGRAHGAREMRDRERECLAFALGLSEGRPLRDVGKAVGWCL
ncbi:hypothetical protein EW146_g4495 [Bondarzewia mesenterica]|uniref:TPR-like protein n=1 Tax=Bondarzewia mesenterica TaxID=1095465 RepID=A0A4S4M054_9AGAM|nr:hypothetical protein EW146_g4495 [Bondarzewia mesenterica]